MFYPNPFQSMVRCDSFDWLISHHQIHRFHREDRRGKAADSSFKMKVFPLDDGEQTMIYGLFQWIDIDSHCRCPSIQSGDISASDHRPEVIRAPMESSRFQLSNGTAPAR